MRSSVIQKEFEVELPLCIKGDNYDVDWDAYLWRFSKHTPMVRDPRQDPDLAGWIGYFLWSGNALEQENVAGERDVCVSSLVMLHLWPDYI